MFCVRVPAVRSIPQSAVLGDRSLEARRAEVIPYPSATVSGIVALLAQVCQRGDVGVSLPVGPHLGAAVGGKQPDVELPVAEATLGSTDETADLVAPSVTASVGVEVRPPERGKLELPGQSPSGVGRADGPDADVLLVGRRQHAEMRRTDRVGEPIDREGDPQPDPPQPEQPTQRVDGRENAPEREQATHY